MINLTLNVTNKQELQYLHQESCCNVTSSNASAGLRGKYFDLPIPTLLAPKLWQEIWCHYEDGV